MSNPEPVLQQLMAVLVDRREKRPAGSYTTQLFDKGTAKIGEKICEEAAEVVEAATRLSAAGGPSADGATFLTHKQSAGSIHASSHASSTDSPSTGASSTGASAEHDHLVHEAADLIYHLLVMLAYHGITLEQVEAKLASRFGTSGLAEKASRPSKPHA